MGMRRGTIIGLGAALVVFATATGATLVASIEGDGKPLPSTSDTSVAATAPTDRTSSTPPSTTVPPTTEAPVTTEPPLRSFTIAATGDFLIHSLVYQQALTYGGTAYDFGPMLAEVEPLLSAADLAICHVEVPLSADNADLSGYPLFSAPHELADDIAAAGYDTCSTVSNHALDRGVGGIQATLDALDAAGVGHAGSARSAEEAAAPNILDAGGVQVAQLAYAYGFNGFAVPAEAPWAVNQIDPARIIEDARRAREAGAEFVVVSLQWGAEYQQAPTADQHATAAMVLASPEVDLIIGHHVHVVQPVGRVGDEVVAYGLGNFLSNQSPEAGLLASTQDGVILNLEVTETALGAFTVTDVTFTPTFVDRTGGYVIRVADPATNAESYARTVAAMTALGTPGVGPDR
jgi:poly-gamma-glutamate capsule biosynthesis protein CapA/YwtB (metallophosphatase superfamily)